MTRRVQDPAEVKRQALERAEKAREKLSDYDRERRIRADYASSYRALDIKEPWKPGEPKPERGRS